MESVYELYYYGGLILAILFLIAAIILFIVLKIPKVFGELTGHSATKSVKAIKEGNGISRSVAKKEQAKYYNQGTGKIKVRETVSEQKRKANRYDAADLSGLQDEEPTEVLNERSFALNTDTEETVVLSGDNTLDGEETEVLSGNRDTDDDVTDVLASDTDDDATDVLASGTDDDATDVLRQTEDDEESTAVLTKDMTDELSKRVKVSYNIVVTHTDESL